MRPRLHLLAAALMVFLTTINAGATVSTPPTGQVKHGPPEQVLGLTVVKEDIAKTLAGDKRALYVDRVGLYSYREQKLLQATLEIARFRKGFDTQSENFRQTVVGHLGGSLPIVVRVGSERVYITTSKGLVLAIWFKDGYMMTLAIRATYTAPKQLIRESVAVNP